jgi:hypothetical protein
LLPESAVLAGITRAKCFPKGSINSAHGTV